MELAHNIVYAVMILQELRRNKKPVTKFHLSDVIGVPPEYVQQMIIPLLAAGLVASQQGRYGGYLLADPAHKITLREVIDARQGEPSLRTGAVGAISTVISQQLDKALDKLQVDALQ
jgi:Rrf2 family protein